MMHLPCDGGRQIPESFYDDLQNAIRYFFTRFLIGLQPERVLQLSTFVLLVR